MTRNFTRILVPTDFSAPSNAALALAKRMATTSGASLHLIHVLEDPFAAAAHAAEVNLSPPAGLRESWLEGAKALLEAQLTPDERASLRSTQLVVFGAPAREIVDQAAANDIDLIVMGTARPWQHSAPAHGKRRRTRGPHGAVPGTDGERDRKSTV